ncbi:MAG: ATP-binding protein [Salinivirgaceae bacterium]|jgi:energy-coupling factor transporter ATP-binding protein EcfA2|nr:ATP-binding protein [Salinivirgaceae bacterium]
MDNQFKEFYNTSYARLSELAKEHVALQLQRVIPKLMQIECSVNERKVYLADKNRQEQNIELAETAKIFQNSIEQMVAQIGVALEEEQKAWREQLLEIIEQELANFSGELKTEQHANRFCIIGHEGFLWKVIKAKKAALFYLHKAPLHVWNFIRRLAKKESIPIHFWTHTIPLTEVAQLKIASPFVGSLVQLEQYYTDQMMQQIVCLQHFTSHVEQQPIYLEEQTIDWEAWKQSIRQHVNTALAKLKDENSDAFEEYIEKSGTVELPSFYLRWKSGRMVDAQFSSLQAVAKRQTKEWQSLLFRWQFQLRLAAVASKIDVPKYQFMQNFRKKVSQSIVPLLDEIFNVTDELKAELDKLNENDDELLRSFVVKGVYKMNKTLAPKIDELSDLNFVQQLLNSTGRLENLIGEIIESVSPDQISYDKTNEDTRDEVSKAWNTSLKTYVSNTLLPAMLREVANLKHELAQYLETLSVSAHDLHHILDFCFDNALEIIDQNENKGHEANENAWDILHSGFDNAARKNASLHEIVDQVHAGFLRNVLQRVTVFSNLIKVLHFEKNINEIYLKVAKNRVVTQAQWFRKSTDSFFSILHQNIGHFFKLNYVRSNVLINALKRKLRLSKPSTHISSELSNFLVEANENIKRLPLVYRRLFELKPIDENNLFLGRGGELIQLNRAYKDWVSGNYAATVIHGENGSGKSSLINYFVGTLKSKHKTVAFSVDRFYYTENDFYNIVNEVLGFDAHSEQEYVEGLKGKLSKRIIVVDGLERLFLRKVHGNVCLQMILDLIIQTNENIFWVFTCAQHGWTYLDKIYRIGDYFDYTIQLESVKQDEIQDIIFKRNRLSGYDVVYGHSGVELTKNFNKMTLEEQQTYLEKRYFLKLNQFAQSNVSLALSYWLVSIQKIKDKKLHIKSFKTPEFSFLSHLSDDKIHALLFIVLHGKITVETLALILYLPEQKSSRILTIMKEDGLLVYSNGYYALHSMLYRHIVELLQKQNLIH